MRGHRGEDRKKCYEIMGKIFPNLMEAINS